MEYYSFEKIDETGANWRVIFGERSNGKTYGSKKKMISNFLSKGKQFAYVRRNVEEIKTRRISAYWDDMVKDGYLETVCKKHFGKEYHGFYIIPKNGGFFLHGCKNENDFNLGKIGYYFALNQARYDKTNPYPDVNMIVFDEFLCKPAEEIPDEFTLLLNLVSTIKRKREDMVIYLLGNTVNRNSQIMEQMHINLKELKQGEIRVFDFYSETAHNTVAVEYTENFKQSEKSESFFTFGNQKERMILKGEWETGEYHTSPAIGLDDKNVDLALVCAYEENRIYVYVGLDDSAYVSEKRIPWIKKEFLTLTTGKTFVSRNTLNKNDPRAEDLVRYLRILRDIGGLVFDKNETGFDFDVFLMK